LDQPEHRQIAIDAFSRIGLWHESLAAPQVKAAPAVGPLVWSPVRRDDEPRPERVVDEMAHLLEMDEPMAGAGAQLSGLHVMSETEKALKRATRLESSNLEKSDRGLGSGTRVHEIKPVSATEPQVASLACRDDEPQPDRLVDEMTYLLEMDEPMAGAGAQLSGLHVKSETEKALERTARLESADLQESDRAIGNKSWVRVALVAALAIMALLLIRVLTAAGYSGPEPSASSSLVLT
jgi:LEA14-like dessication related protein